MAPKRCLHKLQVILLTLIAFLIAASASWAATYYVDATFGNDAGDGLSPSTAWRTIAKINVFNFIPGDSVLLKRGETWREALKLNVSGAPNNPIVVDAYGTGPNPKLLGSDTKTGGANWTQESPNIWFCVGISWDPEMVFHDGVGSSKEGGEKSPRFRLGLVLRHDEQENLFLPRRQPGESRDRGSAAERGRLHGPEPYPFEKFGNRVRV